MSTSFTEILEELARHKGVRASLAVDARDGISIDSTLQFGQDGARVAALAASLYRKARRSAGAAGLGMTGFMQLESERGRLCMLGGDDVLLVIVANHDANVGLIRLAMLRAADRLA